MTEPRLRHLRAAADGRLHVNDRGGLVRRWVMDGGGVSQAVCEKLIGDGLIEKVELPGRAIAFDAGLTAAGRDALAAAEPAAIAS